LGNVRTEQIKRVAKELIKRFPDKFSVNFDENKHMVAQLTQGTTVKVRNQIAGYITRSCAGTMASESETEEEEAAESEEATSTT